MSKTKNALWNMNSHNFFRTKGLNMSYIYFEDDDFDNMLAVINSQQMCYHPVYAPDGQFTVKNIFKLDSKDKDITIIADNNLVSPICEIAKKGRLNNELRMQKAAMFVTWTKSIHARLTCGVSLFENDTVGLATIPGEEYRLAFLHALDNIPAQIWKEIAFASRDSIPDVFLYTGVIEEIKEYQFGDNLLLLSNEAAMVKMVQLIRNSELTAIDKFIDFMNWYADNLDIAESVVVYAAMIFANIPDVAPPKNAKVKDYQKVVKGIKNQTWDVTYITLWSMFYYRDENGKNTMFATDDETQKRIVLNIIPTGEWSNAISAIFTTKNERKKLQALWKMKFGDARIRPFTNMQDEEKVLTVKNLLSHEYEVLKKMLL